MKRARLLSFFAGMLLLRLTAVAADEPPGQLPPRSNPGTFRFSESVTVNFSQKDEFPVDFVLENFAHREVFRSRIQDAAEVVTCDLAPGSYDQRVELDGKTQADYVEDSGQTLFISSSGKRAIFDGQVMHDAGTADPLGNWKPFNAILRRKIETLSPALDSLVPSGHDIHFSWKPIAGVHTYTVAIMGMDVADRPGTVNVNARPLWVVHRPALNLPWSQLPSGFEHVPAYCWTINDGDEKTSRTPTGQVARGISLFRTGRPPVYSASSYPEDEWIDMRGAVRFVQPHISADGIPGVDVAGLGAGSPFTVLGLGARIYKIDGKTTYELNDVKTILAAAPAGATLQVEIRDDSVKPTYRRTRIVVLK